MPDEPLTYRVNTPMSELMVDALNEYCHESRIRSRSAVIRKFVQEGLDKALKKGQRRVEPGKKP